jgi:hypothetical protein
MYRRAVFINFIDAINTKMVWSLKENYAPTDALSK